MREPTVIIVWQGRRLLHLIRRPETYGEVAQLAAHHFGIEGTCDLYGEFMERLSPFKQCKSGEYTLMKR